MGEQNAIISPSSSRKYMQTMREHRKYSKNLFFELEITPALARNTFSE